MQFIRPVIFEYLDVLSYLKDYYLFRKSSSDKFSYETWSRELGLNSRSFLRMIVIGKKKVTAKLAEAITNQNFSTKLEKEYFVCLVKYSHARNSEERQKYGQKLMQILRSQYRPQIVEKYEGFGKPLLPRLLTLIGFRDVGKSDSNLAKILKVKETEIKNALEVLEKLNLINKINGEWVSEISTFKVPDKYGNSFLRQFHYESLEEAMRAFDLPKETRRFKSLILALNEKSLADLNQMLDEFSSEQVQRYECQEFASKNLYQLNFNIYPVTEC